jgi:mRNA interferase YafQ
MYEIRLSKSFKKSYKRASSSKRFSVDDFNSIFWLLESGAKLPERFRDHGLRGNSSGLRECHVASDCLLIYEIDDKNKTIRFIGIGNHANLFE